VIAGFFYRYGARSWTRILGIRCCLGWQILGPLFAPTHISTRGRSNQRHRVNGKLIETLHQPVSWSKSAIDPESCWAIPVFRLARLARLSNMSELRTAPSRPYSRRTDSALLRLDQVLERIALGKTQLYALVASGGFPKPIHLGPRCVRWHAGDVCAWIDEKRTS